MEDYPPAQAAGYPQAQAVALLRVLGAECLLGQAEDCLLAQAAAYQLGPAAVCRPGLGADYLPVLAGGFQQGPAAGYRADLEEGYQQARHLITATFRQGRSTSSISRNKDTAGHTRSSAKRGASNDSTDCPVNQDRYPASRHRAWNLVTIASPDRRCLMRSIGTYRWAAQRMLLSAKNKVQEIMSSAEFCES